MPTPERSRDGRVIRKRLDHEALGDALDATQAAANEALEALKAALDREAAIRAMTTETHSERMGGGQ
ncbi:MAG: hypothetical protein QOI06_1491 [Nocardioidaceae bacterium]|nr:hypothetical protein [Nocardioidaceae bacterium]